MTTIALAGDTMLGRNVADAYDEHAPEDLFAPEIRAATRAADVVVVNLECCISSRGERWPDPRKPFFFRAPPVAVDSLHALGVDAVTLANNHALDYGETALLDTLEHLAEAGIAVVGAGDDVEAARRPAALKIGGVSVEIVAFTDHPKDFAAGPDRPGVALAALGDGVPAWVTDTIRGVEADVVLVTPHWGPNMTSEPVSRVASAAPNLVAAGADLVAGHSAHVFHGVEIVDGVPVCYDLGDFIDDYAVDPRVRNDLGLLWFVVFEEGSAVRVEALPLALDYCYTRFAEGDERDWIERRFRTACRDMDTEVQVSGDRLVVDLDGAV